MRIKNKPYAMALICAVDHIEMILTEKVPMGERDEVLKYISDRLSKKKTVELPRAKGIQILCMEEV